MRNLFWALLLVGCGGSDGPSQVDGGTSRHDMASLQSQHDGSSNSQTLGDLAGVSVSDGGMHAGPITDAGPADCPIPCGAGTYCNNGSCAPLQTNCPCPLGSYCDLTDMTCKGGCRTDQHCPMGQICDTRRYQCARDCKSGEVDCGHFDCVDLPDGRTVCGGCDSMQCDCAPEQWGDCNMNPGDGCETDLDTLDNCYQCGDKAATTCLVDADGDDYGVKGSDTTRCRCGENGYIDPPDQFGATPPAYDCDDADPGTHPGGTYHASPNPQGSYDYNCDGMIEKYVLTATTDAACTQFHECAPVATNVACGAMYTISYCYLSNNQCVLESYMGAEPCQ